MAASIDSALDAIEADDGAAACRLAIDLGDAFSFCQQPVMAQRWYEAAHQFATASGDQAAVGALTYNRAALHVSNLRLKALDGPCSPSEVSLAHTELRSAINYQTIAQLKSLNHLLQSSAIGVAALERRYADALRILEAASFTAEVPTGSAESALQKADLAMCLAQVGRMAESRQAVREAISMRLEDFGADDRAIILGSIARAAEICESVEYAVHYWQQSHIAVVEHGSIIGVIGKLIEKYSEPSRLAH